MDSTPFYGERGPIPFFLGRKSSVCKKRLWTKWFYILSQPLSLLCARMHMSVFAFRGLLRFGFALAVEGFELFQLFRALGEGLGALDEHGVPNVVLN